MATTHPMVARGLAVVEDAEWLVATGECWTQAIRRLGYTNPSALERVLYRHGRGDLVTALKARELSERERGMHRSTRAA